MKLSHQQLEEMTARLLDPAYRLAGEDPLTVSPKEAADWIEVYTELLAFKHSLLDGCTDRLHEMGEFARREIAESDIVMLEMQISRCNQQLDFWRLRKSQLS